MMYEKERTIMIWEKVYTFHSFRTMGSFILSFMYGHRHADRIDIYLFEGEQATEIGEAIYNNYERWYQVKGERLVMQYDQESQILRLLIEEEA